MKQLDLQIAEATAAIRKRWTPCAMAGIVLGTGMGRIADQIQPSVVIEFADVPHFPGLTALGHRGRLVCGAFAGAAVVMLDGRAHAYEGYPLSAITLPVRVVQALGANVLVLSNASGGINAQYASGDVVVIEDHINLMWGSPLTGPSDGNPPWWGLSTARPYDPELIDRALAIARHEDFTAHRGVYVGMTGPNYETPAEYRFLRQIGGDVVGMSTVPEAIVAAECGLKVLALSTVTNVARPDTPQQIDAQDVLHDAEIAAPNVGKIVRGVLAGEVRSG